jgi:hypothetical protein
MVPSVGFGVGDVEKGAFERGRSDLRCA